MILALSAAALAAATPVATTPTAPDHTGHHAAPSESKGKGCCCCDGKANETNAGAKKMECGETQEHDAAPAEHSQHNH